MEGQYWWLRFGNYPPGLNNLPHMGEVIADYRRRRYGTREAFATVVGDKVRNIQEWEAHAMMADTTRRIFLARLLQIPPALLGLNWHQVYEDRPPDEYTSSREHLLEATEENTYYIYEDVLALGYECFYRGGASQLTYRLNRSLNQLKALVPQMLPADREVWQTLLVRFYWLCGSLAQRDLAGQALDYYMPALTLATQLDDKELICHSYHLLADEYEKQGRFTAARDAIQAAKARFEDMRSAITPLKGNVFLRAASIKTQLAGSSEKEQSEVKALQDKAAVMLYKGDVEGDITFLKFNLAAVNHEKGKSMLHFARLRTSEGRALSGKDADAIQARLRAALEAVPPDLVAWKMYFHLTEAELYQAQHDLEASAYAGKEALKAAKVAESLKCIDQVKALYTSLKAKSPNNPYVDNLGVELGLF